MGTGFITCEWDGKGRGGVRLKFNEMLDHPRRKRGVSDVTLIFSALPTCMATLYSINDTKSNETSAS